MISKIVPSASLVAIPRTPTQSFPPKQFSFFSRSFNQTSRLSFSPLFPSFPTQRFVPRAEDPSAEAAVVEEESGEDNEVVEKEPRKPLVKLGDVMGILNKRAIEASEKERPIPDLRTGDVVEIKLEVPENRRRLSIYKGIVISKQNAGIHTTIRVRRIIAGVGVEIVFPIYSPNVKEIRVVTHRKVRRARLYYLRDKLPRLSTFK